MSKIRPPPSCWCPFTGPLYGLGLTGASGKKLQETWRDGIRSYLGTWPRTSPTFHGRRPAEPRVASNVVVSIEQAVDWIADLIEHAHDTGATLIEATAEAENEWVAFALAGVVGFLLSQFAEEIGTLGKIFYIVVNVLPTLFLMYFVKRLSDIDERGHAVWAAVATACGFVIAATSDFVVRISGDDAEHPIFYIFTLSTSGGTGTLTDALDRHGIEMGSLAGEGVALYLNGGLVDTANPPAASGERAAKAALASLSAAR